MTQANVLKFLRENEGKYFSVKEIADKIRIGEASVRANCNKLSKNNEIFKKLITKKEENRTFYWGAK